MYAVNPILIAALWDAQFIRWVVWVGLVVLTVALLLLIRTRWGQQKPLGKCIVLSLLAHSLLAIYMTTVHIVTASNNSPDGEGVHVAIVDGSNQEMADAGVDPDDWSAVSPDAETMPLDSAELAPLEDVPAPEPATELERDTPTATLGPIEMPPAPASDDAPPPELVADNRPILNPDAQLEPVEMPKPEQPSEADPMPPPDVPPPEPGEGARDATGEEPGTGDSAEGEQPAGSNADAAPQADLDGAQGGPAPALPEIYQGRRGDHLEGGRARGATKQSEAAVAAALRWLADNQSTDGRWNPRRLGGGGLAADNQHRDRAGATADTGLTGLALLAFLAAGHTHLEGDYRETVRHGLVFLMRSQDVTGNLAATNNQYERMYCHAMAACALSEAYAMTRDEQLLGVVQKALSFTRAMQHRASGGWRYQFGQSGDTSQLGWQVMALRSAELGGLAMHTETRAGIERFLRSVSLGGAGGLACYEPRRPVSTRSMTAEAMVCRQFMGYRDQPETIREASDFILQQLPGTGRANHYYWYYATLALYHSGGEPWRRWNEALQKNLVGSQRLDGWWAGSWDPDPVWGHCGGRIYSTALCTLSLEVYYRYLPLYVQTARRGDRAP